MNELIKLSEIIWNWTEELQKLKNARQKHIAIIGIYYEVKGIEHKNKLTLQAGLKRDLRPAMNLIGYDMERIVEVMEWLKENADYKWTLETVHKYIDEDLGNLGGNNNQLFVIK